MQESIAHKRKIKQRVSDSHTKIIDAHNRVETYRLEASAFNMLRFTTTNVICD